MGEIWSSCPFSHHTSVHSEVVGSSVLAMGSLAEPRLACVTVPTLSVRPPRLTVCVMTDSGTSKWTRGHGGTRLMEALAGDDGVLAPFSASQATVRGAALPQAPFGMVLYHHRLR